MITTRPVTKVIYSTSFKIWEWLPFFMKVIESLSWKECRDYIYYVSEKIGSKIGEPSTCEDSRKFSKEPTMLSIPNPPQLYNFGFSDPIFCLKLSLLNSNVQFLILDFWYVNIAAQHLRQKCALSFDISYIIYDFFWVLNFFTSISWLSGFKMSNSSGWRRGKSVPWELPDNGRGGRKVGFYGRLPS